MKKRGSRKRKAPAPSLLDTPASTELFQRCFSSNIILGCLAPFLSLSNLIRFLRCDKRLYAIGHVWWNVLRECCRLHGPALDVTNKWVKQCLRSRNLEALRWLFNDRLRCYIADDDRTTRHTNSGNALVCCLPISLRTAFKMGYREGIDCILDWRAKELTRAMLSTKGGDVYHLYNYVGTTEAIQYSLPAAMVAGCEHGQSQLVREFFETHCQDFVFPRDAPRQMEIQYELDSKEREKLAYDMLFGCVSNGDVTNYPFYAQLYESCADSKRSKERLFVDLLTTGKNPTLLPVLVSEVRYPKDWVLHYEWLRHAFCNRNPCMLRYVLSIIPPHQLPNYRVTLRQEFLSIKMLLGKACGQLTWNMENRRLLKLINSLQARYLLLRDMLANEPFGMHDLLETGNTWFRTEWKWDDE